MVRNGVKRSAFKGGGCRADSCFPAPASLNECCAFILLMVSAWRGQQTRGGELLLSRTWIFDCLVLFWPASHFVKAFMSDLSLLFGFYLHLLHAERIALMR